MYAVPSCCSKSCQTCAMCALDFCALLCLGAPGSTDTFRERCKQYVSYTKLCSSTHIGRKQLQLCSSTSLLPEMTAGTDPAAASSTRSAGVLRPAGKPTANNAGRDGASTQRHVQVFTPRGFETGLSKWPILNPPRRKA